MKQSCKTCRWAEFKRCDSGRIDPRRCGTCKYVVPMPIKPIFPSSDRIEILRRVIWVDDGKSCPVYEKVPKKEAIRNTPEQRAVAEWRMSNGGD